ncbi:hypothetical protein MPNT_40061 [Candidatus Methylacidithermus pantelleriae]|uniref:Uncharacterized protein n=1 Tax=Candidatus Methylacidithermus pantelleriae TaxID=2744239 RepID=A0A8J2BU83_9BACT|nr:hypothetical protein MPNT_40061 [Candidatus Methylacidithermus pantelleriae]
MCWAPLVPQDGWIDPFQPSLLTENKRFPNPFPLEPLRPARWTSSFCWPAEDPSKVPQLATVGKETDALDHWFPLRNRDRYALPQANPVNINKTTNGLATFFMLSFEGRKLGSSLL